MQNIYSCGSFEKRDENRVCLLTHSVKEELEEMKERAGFY